jgi:hypothetical protein
MKNTVNSIIAHPIVGVPAFVLCSFAKRVAFQIVASLRICFQSFNSCNILINIGVCRKPTKNVAIQNENISTKCDSMFYNLYVYFLTPNLMRKDIIYNNLSVNRV